MRGTNTRLQDEPDKKGINLSNYFLLHESVFLHTLFFYCMRTMPATTNTNIIAKLGKNPGHKFSSPPSPTGQIWLRFGTKLTSTWPTRNVVFFSQHTAVAFPSSISSHTSDEKTRGQIRANRK